TEEAVDARGAAAARAAASQGSERGAITDPRSVPGVSELERIAEASGVRSVSILDGEGRVLAASDGTVAGQQDLDFPAGLVLIAPATEGLSFRPSTHVIDRDGVMVRFE